MITGLLITYVVSCVLCFWQCTNNLFKEDTVLMKELLGIIFLSLLPLVNTVASFCYLMDLLGTKLYKFLNYRIK